MFDETILTELIDFTDEAGVLSLYAGFDPSRAGDPQPTQPLEIRQQLKETKAGLEDTAPDRVDLIDERIEELGDTVGGLLDPKAPGRGRALFVRLSDGDTRSVSLQIPFKERVVVHDNAYVRPLVAAHDEGRAAGILVVHRAGVRVLEWSIGEVDELETREFELGDAQLADIKSGPSVNNPQRQAQGIVNRERFEDRVDENRARFLKDAIGDVVTMTDQHGWDRLVVAGTPKLRDEVFQAVPETNGLERLLAEHTWEAAAPHEIAEQVWPVLRSVHRQREVDLVEQAKDRALSGGAGALGISDTLRALNEGRVDHLLFQSTLELEGFVSEAKTLHFEEADPMAQGVELTPEPLLVERMVEKAFGMGGKVTPVEEEAAGFLGEHGAVGALLRW